jgi:hypothetical protein
MVVTERIPGIVRSTLQLEQAAALDRPVRALERPIASWFGTGARGSALRGEWLGHALHPILTDVAIGTWTSASLLDLLGGAEASASSRTLIGIGLVTAAPTAWTGWAEWSAVPFRDKKVGLVHAVTNGLAIAFYARSWAVRGRGRRGAGVRLALAGAAVSGFGAYLGGHLALGRRVASHHPAYDDHGPADQPSGGLGV